MIVLSLICSLNCLRFISDLGLGSPCLAPVRLSSAASSWMTTCKYVSYAHLMHHFVSLVNTSYALYNAYVNNRWWSSVLHCLWKDRKTEFFVILCRMIVQTVKEALQAQVSQVHYVNVITFFSFHLVHKYMWNVECTRWHCSITL